MAKPTDTRHPKTPKTETLRILMVPTKPKPEPDGAWRFDVIVDGKGTTGLQIVRNTSNEAKSALAEVVYCKLKRPLRM